MHYDPNKKAEWNAYQRHWRRRNREKALASSRRSAKKWQASPAGKEWQRQYRIRNRDRIRSRRAVHIALRAGTLVKSPCQLCGDPIVEAHHDDYSRPLRVRWLCKKHHERVHHPDAYGLTSPQSVR